MRERRVVLTLVLNHFVVFFCLNRHTFIETDRVKLLKTAAAESIYVVVRVFTRSIGSRSRLGRRVLVSLGGSGVVALRISSGRRDGYASCGGGCVLIAGGLGLLF